MRWTAEADEGDRKQAVVVVDVVAAFGAEVVVVVQVLLR